MDKEQLRLELQKISTEGKSTTQIYNEICETCMRQIPKKWNKDVPRKAAYISMEFLVGRWVFNNLAALGILDLVREVMGEKGFDLNELEDIEDAALGNGGLGRLAACFLDSAAAGGYPLDGYGIRYRYGLFRQSIEDGFQKESPDDWLKYGDPWSRRVERESQTIVFADLTVRAVPYDVPIFGSRTNILRLWQAEGSEAAQKISDELYPDDSEHEGKLLRLRQEYFLSAATIRDLIQKFKKQYGNQYARFPEFHTVQLNDTHPVLSIAEFLRILTREHRVSFADAVAIARKVFNYTNHTILPEALECWDESLVSEILPDIAMILKRLQLFATGEWNKMKCTHEEQKAMGICISDEKYASYFSMANAAVFISRKVNGVARIHSEIIKKDLFATAYKYYPDKFTNVTNGVTQRRWLQLCNEELAEFYDRNLGLIWRQYFKSIAEVHATNPRNVADFREIKALKKQQLAAYIEKYEGIKLLPNAIYIAQIKRLHEYKRQLMTALAILRIYYMLKEGKLPDFIPQVYIFGAKAAPGYFRAKAIIKYINEIAKLINSDPEVNDRLQVVFVQNYNVSYAEEIIPGSDVSLQVSTAGFEASGTGNMKLMMNGAVTVGTLDGANIEIMERAGEENNYIFGATVDWIAKHGKDYDPVSIVEKNPAIKQVVETLIDGTFSDGGTGYFEELYNALLKGAHWHKPDYYFVLKDLEEMVETLLRVDRDYADESAFARKQLKNATSAAHFSSDRSIEQYAMNIWHIKSN